MVTDLVIKNGGYDLDLAQLERDALAVCDRIEAALDAADGSSEVLEIRDEAERMAVLAQIKGLNGVAVRLTNSVRRAEIKWARITPKQTPYPGSASTNRNDANGSLDKDTANQFRSAAGGGRNEDPAKQTPERRAEVDAVVDGLTAAAVENEMLLTRKAVIDGVRGGTTKTETPATMHSILSKFKPPVENPRDPDEPDTPDDYREMARAFRDKGESKLNEAEYEDAGGYLFQAKQLEEQAEALERGYDPDDPESWDWDEESEETEVEDERAGGDGGVNGKKRISDSGTPEWYTPEFILDLVRKTFGGAIELDPASCDAAQEVVGAKRYYTVEDDGLAQDWSARNVFLNPPYSAALMRGFADKLIHALDQGLVGEAIFLCNTSSESGFWQDLAGRAALVFLPRGKIGFDQVNEDGERYNAGPGGFYGRTLFYFGDDPGLFHREFSRMNGWFGKPY